jgi:hypothetical protein
LGFAYVLKEGIEKRLREAPPSTRESERFYRDADLYFRSVRQFDRLVQIARHLFRPAGR